MISGLGPAAADVIDTFLNKRCSGPADYGELEQLRQLFTARFRRGLERLLNGTLLHGGRPVVCDVQIGWIDKIPVARAASLTTATEIGDAVVFSIDQQVDGGGNVASVDASALLLQAKIATGAKQISAPTVPVGTSASTPNELALLSGWPTFDLRATGASQSDLLRGVDVAPSSHPAPHAWFVAAPGEAPLTSTGWPCWWMAGRALRGDPCTTTFGQLLVAFLDPQGAGRAVGFPFEAAAPGGPPFLASAPIGPSSDWSDLCNAIWSLLPRYAAPRSKFRLPKGQFGPPFPRRYSIPRRASAFLSVGPTGLRLASWAAVGAGPTSASRGADDPFRKIRRGGPIVPRSEERGLFVLEVTTTRLLDVHDRR